MHTRTHTHIYVSRDGVNTMGLGVVGCGEWLGKGVVSCGVSVT